MEMCSKREQIDPEGLHISKRGGRVEGGEVLSERSAVLANEQRKGGRRERRAHLSRGVTERGAGGWWAAGEIQNNFLHL